jgi:predicted Zn-dependent protease
MKHLKWTLLTAGLAMIFSLAQAASEKEVRRQARVQWLEMKRHLSPEPDARVQRYVQCVANRVLAELPAEQANLEWEVVVFDDETVNAFADPNGKVGVFNGLLKVADTPDSLAAVLGHEIAHATEGHVMNMARRAARQDMWVLLGSAGTGLDPGLLREGAAIGLALPFAREQETAADLVGLRYMARAGFDPRAAIYLWKSMSAAQEGKNRPPEFLSDHPSDDARLDDIVKQIVPALVEYNAAREAGKRPNCQMVR